MSRRILLLPALLLAGVAAVGQTQPITITTTSPLPTGYEGIPYALTFSATTNPPNQQLVWSIAKGSGNLPSGLSLASDGSVSGTPNAGSAGPYTFTIQAQFPINGAIISTTKTFTMTVATPQVTIVTPSPLPDGFIGQPYSQVLQATSVPNRGITWLPATPVPGLGLTLSPGGLLSGTPNVGCTPCVVRVTAQITGTNVSTTTNYNLTIFAGRVVITTTSLPLAPVGQRYAAQLTANPAGATWALVNGVASLPPGITFSASGAFSGVPTTPGAYPLLLQAAVQGYVSAQTSLTLYVTNGPLQILETSIPTASQNVPYRITLTPSGGLPPYQWSTTNSIGMSIGAASGTITGTPAAAGVQSLPVTLTDSTGTVFNETFSLLVVAPLSVLTTSLPNGAVGSLYNQNLQTAGGQAPFSWSLVQGSLPPGLTLSVSGSIVGVPANNGAFGFTVQVTDAGQRVATKSLSIAVTGSALTITTASLADGVIGVTYSQTLTASGATPTYTWAIVSGTPPAGLSLDPKSGALGGTPTGPVGTSTFTVQVTDSTLGAAPLTAQKAFTVKITAPPPLAITTTSLSAGSVGVAYAQTLQASGGSPPDTWSITSGSLPVGLQLSPAGGISGTPSAAGKTTLTFTVTDSAKQTASATLSITISGTLTITTGNLTTTVGSAFSQALAAAGGTPPYTFALTNGTLPAGLAFVASSGSINGTPTAAGASAVTFTVTDAANQKATATITVTANLPATPPVTFTVGASSSQPPVALCLGSGFPVPVTGALSLNFQPSSSVAVGTDTSVQFASPGQGSTVSFTLPQCGSAPPASAVVTMGTVAGTVTIGAKITANGLDITPGNVVPQTITIPAAPPVIQSVTLTPGTSSVTVTVIGYSSTREVISGLFHFAPASGSTFSQSDLTVQLGSAYTTWYQNAASNAFGSQFKLTVPFTLSGSASSVVAVTVTLTNTKGASAAATSQ